MHNVLGHTREEQRETVHPLKVEMEENKVRIQEAGSREKKPRTSDLESCERKSATMRSETMRIGSKATTYFLKVQINNVTNQKLG